MQEIYNNLLSRFTWIEKTDIRADSFRFFKHFCFTGDLDFNRPRKKWICICYNSKADSELMCFLQPFVALESFFLSLS